MNDAVEMTTNQFQQNISIKLADDYLSTLLTGNVMKFPVDLTKIFNSEYRNIILIVSMSAICQWRSTRIMQICHLFSVITLSQIITDAFTLINKAICSRHV